MSLIFTKGVINIKKQIVLPCRYLSTVKTDNLVFFFSDNLVSPHKQLSAVKTDIESHHIGNLVQ